MTLIKVFRREDISIEFNSLAAELARKKHPVRIRTLT